jgi:DNA (cytosine-5)-methyltransferase 1
MRYVVENPEPFIVSYYGSKGPDFRGQSINQPLKTQTTENRFALVAPVLTEHANASSPRCMPANDPLRTICAQTKGGHHALVSAFLAKHYGGVVGTGVDVPISTVTSVDHHSLVTAHIARQFGKSVGSAVDYPLGTITAGGSGKSLLVNAFLLKYYGSDQDPRLDEPMHTVTSRDRFGLVTVHGQEYQIVDIGMRMLTPRELYRAQGFPENYIIEYGVEEAGEIVHMTKTAQVRMCGNSVCPDEAAALVSANVADQTSVEVAV